MQGLATTTFESVYATTGPRSGEELVQIHKVPGQGRPHTARRPCGTVEFIERNFSMALAKTRGITPDYSFSPDLKDGVKTKAIADSQKLIAPAM